MSYIFPNEVLNGFHELEQQTDEIEHRGAMAFHDVRQGPYEGEQYVSHHFVICLTLEGNMTLEYDMQPVVFGRHDISVIYPNHILRPCEASSDYRGMLVVVSSRCFEQLRLRHPYRNHYEFQMNPSLHLNEVQYECMSEVMHLLATICGFDHSSRMDMLTSQIDVLAELLSLYRLENGSALLQDISSAQQLFIRFYDALTDHYAESREVRYYADLLCLSPKYFGSVIKQETGCSVGEWISRYVVSLAKSMLAHRHDLSIQQVSNMLGFADQMSFSRYFKSEAGMSPREYRRKIVKE